MDMEKLVILRLGQGGRDEKIESAYEVGKLSSRQKHRLVERGVMAPLILMLQSGDYEAIAAALSALLSLAYGSERNKIHITNSGVIPALLQILQWQNRSLVELVIAVLLVISSCTVNKLVIASSGAISILVATLGRELQADSGNDNTSSISKQAEIDIIATLRNLSTCHQNIHIMVSSGIVPTLLQLMHSQEKSSELVEKASILLESILTSSRDALLQAASKDRAVRTLVEAIEEGSPQCQEHAASILLLICQSSRDRYRGVILNEGVVPGLLQLRVDGTRRGKQTAGKLLQLLRDCSSNGSARRQSKYEFLEQIMQEIDAEGDGFMGTTTLKLVEETIAKLNL